MAADETGASEVRLTHEQRLGLVSARMELLSAAQQLFVPSAALSDFLERLAERTGCFVALLLERLPPPAPGLMMLAGAAGLSRVSRELPLEANPVEADRWPRLALPYPELMEVREHRWCFWVVPPDHPAPCLLQLYFEKQPPHEYALRGLVESAVSVLHTAICHRRLYTKLQQQKALLESENEAAVEGILVVSRDLRVVSANRRFLELLGLSALEEGEPEATILDRALGEVEDRPAFLSMVARRHDKPDEVLTDELTLRSGRVLELYSAPIRSVSGESFGTGWYFRDITERKMAEAQRARLLWREQSARAAAERAVQLRDEFLSVASHELKTPLTPLLLRLDALMRGASQGRDSNRALLEKARCSLKRLSELVDELLDFSRIQGGRFGINFERCSLTAVVHEVVEGFQAVSSTHSIALEDEGPELWVEGDSRRLEQVLTNLVDNAIKYSPTGGVIRVRLGRAAENATVSVSDQGIGIPSDQRSALFERFFRGSNAPSRSYGGLGLGLYISRDIVERHGGEISVDSEVGRGSTFSVSLPLAPVQPSAAPAPERERTGADAQGV